MFDGILLIDKEQGWTSHDVVAKVRSLLRHAALVQSYKAESKKNSAPLDFQTFKPSTHLPKVKVGHTGTLDPLATGLMVLVVGSYCKRAQEFSKLDKVYEVKMKLGFTSDTGDAEGQIIKTKKQFQVPDDRLIYDTVLSFQGAIEQTPPAYSAIKVNGKKAYELARSGKAVKLEPRRVTIYEIADINYDYPMVTFTARVSSGTYIRSLVEDIGKKLGSGAYMTSLRRTQVGEFSVDDAVPVTDVGPNNILTR